jgi:hypothetical protein
MAQHVEKTHNNVPLALGAFVLTVVVGLGLNSVRRGAWIDLVPKAWLSDKDRAALKNPAAATEAAHQEMSRDAWETSNSIQPQPGWDQGWRK